MISSKSLKMKTTNKNIMLTYRQHGEKVSKSMKKYEINEKVWTLTLMELTTTLPFEVINKLISIKNNGAEDIEEWALPYIDMLYPYLPSDEQIALKEFVKEKFGMIEIDK